MAHTNPNGKAITDIDINILCDLYGLKSPACELELVGLSGLSSQQQSIREDLAQKSTYWTSIEIHFNSSHKTISAWKLISHPFQKLLTVLLCVFRCWSPCTHNSHHVSIMLRNMLLASGNEPKSPALCNLHNLIWMKLTWLGPDNDNIGQLGGLPIYRMFKRALYHNIIQIHSGVVWDW